MPTPTLYEHGYGQVLYTNGPALDHPLRVTRLSYDSAFANPVWITPHANWQGSYDSGEIFNTDNSGTCKNVSSGWYDNTPTASEGSGNAGAGSGAESGGPTHPDSVTVCEDVDWPAPYQWRTYLEHGRGRIGPASWMGSLIEGGRDLTGQMYVRNGFYDPASRPGQHTGRVPVPTPGARPCAASGNSAAASRYRASADALPSQRSRRSRAPPGCGSSRIVHPILATPRTPATPLQHAAAPRYLPPLSRGRRSHPAPPESSWPYLSCTPPRSATRRTRA